MARTQRPRAPAEAPGATRHARSLARNTKAPYKVVFEQVSERKKKLITVLSFDSRAPPGYTFIPAGDPSITNRCKELAREDRLKVFIVSTSRHKHQANLSHEVHRIGYHFPSLVVEKACMSLGVSLTQSGLVIPVSGGRPNPRSNRRSLNKKNINNGASNDSSGANVSQATLDNQAQQAIKDLFPRIPAKDVRAIIGRAFEKGKSRVGTAVELPITRRVQLAVVAHIRHVYTDYDSLLKTGTYYEARAAVEKPCLDLLAQWRSDDDDDPNAMEEILREVIVIDDDDEEDGDRRSPVPNQQDNNRDDSVEIISSHAFADEVQMRPIDYSDSAQIADRDRLYSPEQDNRAVGQSAGLRQYCYGQQYQKNPIRLDPDGIHQLRWREALHRRKNSVSAHTDDNPTVQDLTTPRRSLFQNGFEPESHHLEVVQHQIPPIEPRRSAQSQAPFYTEVIPAQRQERPKSPVGFFANNGSLLKLRQVSGTSHNDWILERPYLHTNPLGSSSWIATKSKQVTIPEQQFSQNRSVDRIDSNQRREQTYNPSDSRFDRQPQVVPSEENRRSVRNRYPEQDAFHNIHQQGHFVPRAQLERVLPSIEGSFQDGRHIRGVFEVSGEHYPEPSHASPASVYENKTRHRIIKLSNEKENRNGKHLMHDKEVLLRSERARQFPREYHHEGRTFVPLKSHDKWLDSHHRHDVPVHLSHMNTFPGEERALYFHPVDTTQNPERNEATKLLKNRADYANHQNQMTDHGQAKYRLHEPFQTPATSISLRPQHQNDLRHANSPVESSPQFPSLHGVHDTLPISHVPLESHKSHSFVDFNLTGKVMYPGVDESDIARFKKPDDGLRPSIKGLHNSSIYQQHNSRQVNRDGNNQTTYFPSTDSATVGAQENVRTGVFLRKIDDGRKRMSYHERPMIENQRVLLDFEQLPRQHFDKTISRHNEFNNTQTPLPGTGTYTGTPTRLPQRSDDNMWYEFGEERPRRAYIQEHMLPGRFTERAERTESTYGSEYVDMVSWNQRIQPEIIEID